ncbi:MAG TPA: diguanylate cyclase [Thermoleophilaceae bacterium]|nr:diguanylate cyclase [Thermoleophilaceae bacterium]
MASRESTAATAAQSPEAGLGWALYDGADEIAAGVLARLEVVGLDRREPGPHVYEAIAETDRLAARVLGRWLATGQEITAEEGQALSALGDLVGEVCLPGLVKAYLAFRDVASDLIARESDRMATPEHVRDKALTMMDICTDGSLVTMCRRFDDERMRLASELVAEQAKLKHLALHDPLTGLANRALFKQSLEEALAQPAADGRVFVLFADLDDFKSVNDTLGHDAGDRLLIEVAGRLKGDVRSTDTVARLGGDEFVILRAGARDAEQESRRLLERVEASLRRPFNLDGQVVRSAASVGSAIADGTKEAEALLVDADAAMYRVKSASLRGV